MRCSIPPELTDDEISAAVDDEADGTILAHLEQCESCRTRFEAAQKIETLLHRKLFRFECPSSQQLGEYELDLLETSERDSIAAHTEGCPRCQAELKTLQQFMALDPIPVPEQPDIPQSRPRKPLRPSVWYAVPAQGMTQYALRGDEAFGPLMFEVNGVTIFLLGEEVEGVLWLVGRLVTLDLLMWKDALVELSQDDKVITVASVDESISFRCRLQNQSPCDLTITSKTGTALVIEDIQVVN